MLYFGNLFHELLILFIAAKPICRLDYGSVIPAFVKKDYLTGVRQMFEIVLEVELPRLHLRRFRESRHSEFSGIEILYESLDSLTLSGRVTIFEDDRYSFLVVIDPILQFDQLRLKLFDVLFVLDIPD
jgi:hypothetical protein